MAETEKAHCNRCLVKTTHAVLHREVSRETEDLGDDEWYDTITTSVMLQCAGCGTVSMRQVTWDSLSQEAGPEEHYPPQKSRREPQWLNRVDSETVKELLAEIYVALHGGQRRLCAMGIRALLEHTMIEKVGDQGSFQRNLSAFQSKGFISPRQRETVDAVLQVGHAAMHRSHCPSPHDLDVALSLTEATLEDVYLGESRAAGLRESVSRSAATPADE